MRERDADLLRAKRVRLHGRTAALMFTLLGCGRTEGMHAKDAGAQAEAPVEASQDEGSQPDMGAAVSAPACWGDARDTLPACAMMDGCALLVSRPPPYQECTRTADCEFTFATPLNDLLGVSVDCIDVAVSSLDPGGAWSLSDDRRTVILTGPACARAKASPSPRFLVVFIHSCIL